MSNILISRLATGCTAKGNGYGTVSFNAYSMNNPGEEYPGGPVLPSRLQVNITGPRNIGGEEPQQSADFYFEELPDGDYQFEVIDHSSDVERGSFTIGCLNWEGGLPTSGGGMIIRNFAQTCSAEGGGVTFDYVSTNAGATSVQARFYGASGLINSDSPLGLISRGFSRSGLTNGEYYVVVLDNKGGSLQQNFIVNCNTAPVCDLTIEEVVPSWNGSTFDLAVIFKTTAQDKRAQLGLNAEASGDYRLSGTVVGAAASGTIVTVFVKDRNGCKASLSYTVPTAVVGCMDPEADNYDPDATIGGACTYSAKVLLSELLDLVPDGEPVLVTLSSGRLPGGGGPALRPAPTNGRVDDVNNFFTFTPPIPNTSLDDWEWSPFPEPPVTLGGTAAPAEALITVPANVPAGTLFSVNGYSFTAGPLVTADKFVDASSLVEALRGVPELVGGYLITQPSLTTVRLVSRVHGTAGNLIIEVEEPLSVELTAGVNEFYSQLRTQWGVYLEVWAECGTDYLGATEKSRAVLADSFEMRYREDNTYVFDIADTLREFTGHELPTSDDLCPDRLVSYFVRYGELYATNEGEIRRRQTTYESSVKWALEACEIVGEYLTSRPAPWVVAPGVVAKVAVLREGGVSIVDAEVVTLVGEAGPQMRFANRQGGFDTVLFEGIREDDAKPTRSTFTGTSGARNLAIQVAQPIKLYSGLLDKPTWDWLRTELAASPSAWLESSDGPQPLRITDFDAQGDVLKQEYFINITGEMNPVSGLSN